MEAQKQWLTQRGFTESEHGDFTRGNVIVSPIGADWRATVAGWVVDAPTPADAIAGAADEAEASYIQHLHDVREARTILEETVTLDPKPKPKMPAWWPTGFRMPNNARPPGS
jgi:hypothetical protein